MRSSNKSLRTVMNPIFANQSPVTIYPKNIVFEDVQSNNCYEIDLHIRNQSKQIQKIRIIHPVSRFFKIKMEEGPIKSLAPGLTLKIGIFFISQKIMEQREFDDCLQVLGNHFKEKVSLKAYPPREKIIIPTVWNLGRMTTNKQILSLIPIKNTGKRKGTIFCEFNQSSILQLSQFDQSLQPGQTKNIELKVKSKRAGPFQQYLNFSNGSICLIKGQFIQQSVHILCKSGQKLNQIDLGQIFVGQKVQFPFLILNNTQQKIQCFFKTFGKNFQSNEIKVNSQLQIFVIKGHPSQYARQKMNCYTAPTHQRCEIDSFSQFQNTLNTMRLPNNKQIQSFQQYVCGLTQKEMIEQPISETFAIKLSNNAGFFKLPIKFISQYPKIKISTNNIDYGEIKDRTDNWRQIQIRNDGKRDIKIRAQHVDTIKVDLIAVLTANSIEKIKINLRPVKSGNIVQIVKLRIFQQLLIQIKIFAICRASSIRAKKLMNLNSSRDLRKQAPIYQTMMSPINFNRTLNTQNCNPANKTDILYQLRTARFNQTHKNRIENEGEPHLIQPNVFLKLQNFDHNPRIKNMIKKQQSQSKVTLKQLLKYSVPLHLEKLSKISLKQTQLSFGNVFIDTEVTQEVTIINGNSEIILFQWNVSNNAFLKLTNSQIVKIQAFSQKTLKVILKSNFLGALSTPLQYIINRTHAFQINVTAFITLINLDISSRSLDFNFSAFDNSFEKMQEVELWNKGNININCILSFAQNKHFYVETPNLYLKSNCRSNLQIFYRPVQGQELNTEKLRVNNDKLIVKIVGGAENIIKCTGFVNETKVTIKENQILLLNHLVSTPFSGKLNIKNHSKLETIYKIQVSPQLAEMFTIEKQLGFLNAQQKKQIAYTFVCNEPKRLSSLITFLIRGGKPIKIPVQVNVVFPQIISNRSVVDFGNIPIMGNNYQELICLTNLHKSEIKLQLFKTIQSQDYVLEVKEINEKATEKDQFDHQTFQKLKKKYSNMREDTKDNKEKRGGGGGGVQKIFRLLPNIETWLQIKFVPKKLKQFDIPFPLKLCGTNISIVQPIQVKLVCCGIEPVVYLQPQRVTFETRILGEGKTSFVKSFEIRNPHDFDIEWRIQTQQNEKGQRSGCFYLSQSRGKLNSLQSVNIEVIFKPQQQGHFLQRLDVVLRQRKVSHISLQIEGNAILPSIKFNSNELIMPVVPIGVESKAVIILQNHGYDAITISKWKTSSHFQSVVINVNFIEGKLLSLAKKYLKVQIIATATYPISFTTLMQFYDEFGNKYQVPLSCTFDTSLMTIYPYIEMDNNIYYDKKQNQIKILSRTSRYQSEQSNDGSASQFISCQFIKNWLNYQLNLGIKSFPTCLVNSQGELLMRMVNRISGIDLIKRNQIPNTQSFSIYTFYSECIRILKTQGAFLNQIRPEFLLPFKDYKNYLHSKNAIVLGENEFLGRSNEAWMVIFYQLIRLYFCTLVTDKMIAKFASLNNSTVPTLEKSSIYSAPEMIVFKFLNCFGSSDDPIYSLGEQVKFFQILQKSLEKVLGLNFTSSLQSLKMSVTVMTPPLFLVLIAKFLHQKLKEYGLCLFLSQSDLYSLGSKELLLFLISYIDMLYHYSNPSNICFEASIGDKITKIIEVENPASRKVKYRVKLLGSNEFRLQDHEISMCSKGRAEVQVTYHCKQNKDQQGKLLLIPVKEDINSAIAQPLSFKLTTSILSKITLRKIQITAKLYEVTSISLQVELPITIADFSQFNVTLTELQQNSNSFFCFSQMNRNLRSNHDKLDIRLVPLSLETKFCRICYRSSIFGEFNYEITAKIESPPISKEIKLKQLKITKQEMVSVFIPRQNQLLSSALRFMNDHHIKIDTNITTKKNISVNKHTVSIIDSPYISVVNQFCQIPRNQHDGNDTIKIDIKCIFNKPFNQYSCMLMVRNDLLKDIRFYKIITSVAMKPKIIPMTVRAKARQSVTIKIPIKIAPCQCTIQNSFQQFLITNYSPHIKQNLELIATFSPEWIMEKQVNVIIQNRQTLEQNLYQISLIAEEPSFFDFIKIQGSRIFKKKVKIPLSISKLEQLRVQSTCKRLILQDQYFSSQKKWVNATILPAAEEQVGNIKLIRQKNGQYFIASLSISNRSISKKLTVTFDQKPNCIIKQTIGQLPLTQDYQIHFENTPFLKYDIVSINGNKFIQLQFSPLKQMMTSRVIYVLIGSQQYSVDVICKSPSNPIIILPQIFSCNLKQKTSSLMLINPSENRGVYRVKIEPKGIFQLESNEFQLKPREKKQVKIIFRPLFLQIRYKAVLKFQCETLPTYEYHLNGISQFDNQQVNIQSEYYNNKESLIDIHFINYFSKRENFTIETDFEGSPFEIVEPNSQNFCVESGQLKNIIVKSKGCNESGIKSGIFWIRYGQKRWKYTLLPLQIKAFTTKKYVWSMKARQIHYESIELPQKIVIKQLQSDPEHLPYLSFTVDQGANIFKLKFNPLKPLPKHQFQVFLIAEQSKFVINCMASVSQPDFDDTIVIKTKQINQVGCVTFKLTNIKKLSTPFQAYLMKGEPDFNVETQRGILEGYGRPGTAIKVKFASNVFNKRVEDELRIQTSEMLWRFKVKGLLSKKMLLN